MVIAHEMPEESCETQASNFLLTNCSIFNQEKIVSSFQKTGSKCRVSVRVHGEEFDLMVQNKKETVCKFISSLRFQKFMYFPALRHCTEVL